MSGAAEKDPLTPTDIKPRTLTEDKPPTLYDIKPPTLYDIKSPTLIDIKPPTLIIGFELNKDYFDRACIRIDAEQRQLSLF